MPKDTIQTMYLTLLIDSVLTSDDATCYVVSAMV
jgi:hypothetical protein